MIQCAPNQPIESENDPIFYASDPARLFFKNTRSHHYQLVTQKSSKIDHYAWKNEPGIVQAVIADNWLSEEAYLLIRLADKGIVDWQIENEKATPIIITPQTRRDHYDAALTLYRALQDGAKLQLSYGAQTIPIFQKEAEKTTFETVVKDYLRLVEKQ
ncbi:MAG: hypothetical protein AAGI23_21905 [Bacteroidota bacterium]